MKKWLNLYGIEYLSRWNPPRYMSDLLVLSVVVVVVVVVVVCVCVCGDCD